LPVPGETVLLLASFLAYSERGLSLAWIVATGTVAATIGDNLGYAIGQYGGRRLLERYLRSRVVSVAAVHRGEALFARYGSATILFARFVFGMRIIAGPLAGVLRMPWKKFVMFNFLGAALWVSVISGVGYEFGSRWGALMHFMKRFDLILGGIFVLIALMLWCRGWKHKAYRDQI
jgi:membrane-associated protein